MVGEPVVGVLFILLLFIEFIKSTYLMYTYNYNYNLLFKLHLLYRGNI